MVLHTYHSSKLINNIENFYLKKDYALDRLDSTFYAMYNIKPKTAHYSETI